MEAVAGIGYLAAEGFEHYVRNEIGTPILEAGRLLVAPGPLRPSYWSQNLWLEPIRIPIASIGDGAKQLKSLQRNWVLYPSSHVRRATLIQEQLPHVSAKPLAFPSEPPTAGLGSWTLLDKDTLLASPRCSSPFAHGEPQFAERKEGPPSRAYLKLWESFTLIGSRPGKGDRCLDAGSCPGGWTWVLQQLGATVVSVDRAPLDPSVAALPRIEFRKGNAFSLLPSSNEHFDWIFSDVACFPEKLLEWVTPWVAASPQTNFICTLKFQGAADRSVIEAFAAIPNSELRHLAHNKHELTWIRLAP